MSSWSLIVYATGDVPDLVSVDLYDLGPPLSLPPPALCTAAMEFARKWILSANITRCGVMVCNDRKVAEVDLKWKWENEELPRVNQCTRFGAEFLNYMRDVYMKNIA